MRISNKILYATLLDIQCELEVLREEIEELKKKKTIIKDLDQPKRKPGRPRKNA